MHSVETSSARKTETQPSVAFPTPQQLNSTPIRFSGFLRFACWLLVVVVVVVVLRDPGAIKVQKANRFDPWVNIYTSIRLWCTIVLWYTRCTDERNE